MASHLPSRFLQRAAVPVAIIILPLLGLYADLNFGEPITDLMGPALYALYASWLIAYGAVLSQRLSATASSIAAGALGTGATISVMIAVLTTILGLFILLPSLPWRGPPTSMHLRLSQFGIGLMLATIAVSPWVTSWALAKVTANTLRSCAAHLGRASLTAWVVVGVGLATLAMSFSRKAESDWLAPRLQVFESDDIARWEKSLSDIKSNWFCGHRRCLMSVCVKLTQRFDLTTGECGPFACPFGFAIEAPNVPPSLAGPFITVYGYPVQQVCAVGD